VEFNKSLLIICRLAIVRRKLKVQVFQASNQLGATVVGMSLVSPLVLDQVLDWSVWSGSVVLAAGETPRAALIMKPCEHDPPTFPPVDHA
jgi:hypothetical protein